MLAETRKFLVRLIAPPIIMIFFFGSLAETFFCTIPTYTVRLIRGRVFIGSTDKPFPYVHLCLSEVHGEDLVQVAELTTDENGFFDFGSVAPGIYKLSGKVEDPNLFNFSDGVPRVNLKVRRFFVSKDRALSLTFTMDFDTCAKKELVSWKRLQQDAKETE